MIYKEHISNPFKFKSLKLLELTNTLAQQLRNVIDHVISHERIDVKTLRCIQVYPTETLDSLQVVFSDRWKLYFDGDNRDHIEVLPFTEWLDIADEAFENRDQLSASYLKEAQKLMSSGGSYLSDLNFSHIQEPAYRAYLISLREELIAQIEAAIRKVAVTYSQDDFSHVVGFVFWPRVGGKKKYVNVLAFNHPQGAGPFYRPTLYLSWSKQTTPYVKLQDSSLILFYPEGSVLGIMDNESNVYTYEIADFKHVAFSEGNKEQIDFRLLDEFKEWSFRNQSVSSDEFLLPWSDFRQFFYELCKSSPVELIYKELETNLLNESQTVKSVLQEEEDVAIADKQMEKLYDYDKEALDVNTVDHRKPLDVQVGVQQMVDRCFEELVSKHPSFTIGKVILKYLEDREMIFFAFHECSSPAMMPEMHRGHPLPVFSTYLQLYLYTEATFGVSFNPVASVVKYDFLKILETLFADPRFGAMAARHVSVIVDEHTSYLHYPDNVWKPYRFTLKVPSNETTIERTLLSENEYVLERLKGKMVSKRSVFESLIEIVNRDLPEMEDTVDHVRMNNRSVGVFGAKPSYIEKPTMDGVPKRDVRRELDVMKYEAFKVLISHPDRDLVKAIVLNGAMYDRAVPVLESIPERASFHNRFANMLSGNMFGLLTEFREDTAVKAFMLQYIDEVDDTDTCANIAFLYKKYDHPSLIQYLTRMFVGDQPEINHEAYIGNERSPKIVALPLYVIRTFEAQLLQIWERYNRESDDHRMNENIIPIFDMLYRLGHEAFSPKLLQKIEKHKQQIERFGHVFDDVDNYPEAFLLRLYRNHMVKTVLQNFDNKHDAAIWPLELASEPNDASWQLTIHAILGQGEKNAGTEFKKLFAARLAANFEKDKNFDHDRLLAYHFMLYVYKHLDTHPELASYSTILIKAVFEHQDQFSSDTDVLKIKEQFLYTLLQAAWNDLKNKNLDLADQKADAILAIDPAMGQAHFLKARLLWLKDGVAAYLAQKDMFVEKATQDHVALARLYNLTGCAMDMEKRYEDALPYFEKAALHSPDDPMYQANIAEVYYKLNKATEAIKFASKAIGIGDKSEMMKEILSNKGLRPINAKE